ncbi:MAG: MBL fold metallo-hydrolase [Candidatus Eisenbacteria bacterium]|nr:MBL fold metallo-hydrolase [Candidatus Eisenbacteria bacterium]
MLQLADGIYWLEGLRSSNAYLLASDHGLLLVDAGMSGDVPRIVSQIESSGRPITELQAIVLTHAHGDHTGGVAKLLRRSSANVMAHKDEVAYIEGSRSLPTRSLAMRAIRWLDDLISGRGDGIVVTGPLEDRDRLDFIGGLQVIHTPGHTPGSISLYQEQREILFCGDLLFNGDLLSGRGGLRQAPRFFSADPDEATRSLNALSKLDVQILCTGHGEPIVFDSSRRMQRVLEDVRT